MKKSDIYEKVNNIIITKLSAGLLPWRKSWNNALPSQNFISKHIYQGINFLLLSCFDFPSPYFLTFLQCKQKEGFVKKGEKGIPIIFWKLVDNKFYNPNDSDSSEQIPFMQLSTVFNLSQTTLFTDESEELKKPKIENFISSIPAVIKNNSKSQCYFNVTKDFISVPVISEFNSTDEYYSTLFHELIHWTGHQSRLNRFQSADYNSDNYSKEELIAEIGSAYLCSQFGINNTLDNSAAYIKGWLSKLNNDDSLFIQASSHAQKAVNYLLTNQFQS